MACARQSDRAIQRTASEFVYQLLGEKRGKGLGGARVDVDVGFLDVSGGQIWNGSSIGIRGVVWTHLLLARCARKKAGLIRVRTKWLHAGLTGRLQMTSILPVRLQIAKVEAASERPRLVNGFKMSPCGTGEFAGAIPGAGREVVGRLLGIRGAEGWIRPGGEGMRGFAASWGPICCVGPGLESSVGAGGIVGATA